MGQHGQTRRFWNRLRGLSKGELTLIACGSVITAGVLCRIFVWPAGGLFAFYVGVAALIGAATNTIAIRALFDPWPSPKYHLPYTGILQLKRRDIENAVASAVGQHLLPKEDIIRCLKDSGKLASYRDRLVEEVRQKVQAPDGLFELAEQAQLKAALKSLRDMSIDCAIDIVGDEQTGRELLTFIANRLAGYLKQDDTYFMVRDEIKKYMGLGGKMLNITGAIDYDLLTHDILNKIRKRLTRLGREDHKIFADEVSKSLGELKEAELPNPEITERVVQIAMEHVKRAITTALDSMQEWDVANSPTVQRIIELALKEVDIKDEVRRKLRTFSHEELKALAMETTREHLGWLEVWGGVLGGIGGSIMWGAAQLL